MSPENEEALRALLTTARLQLAAWLDQRAGDMGSVETCERVGAAIQARYETPAITQLLLRKNLKQVEFAEGLVSSFKAGRGNVGLVLSRTLLEGTVELAWMTKQGLPGSAEDRMLRVLSRLYGELVQRGQLPARELAVLEEARRRGLGLSPKFRTMMHELDKAEMQDGGTPYWESHYGHFEVGSGYAHSSLLGPGRFTLDDDHMHVDMNPDPAENVAALRWGIYYFAVGAAAVLELAGLDGESSDIAKAYADIKPVAEVELDAVLG
jgi:hypothetical protein